MIAEVTGQVSDPKRTVRIGVVRMVSPGPVHWGIHLGPSSRPTGQVLLGGLRQVGKPAAQHDPVDRVRRIQVNGPAKPPDPFRHTAQSHQEQPEAAAIQGLTRVEVNGLALQVHGLAEVTLVPGNGLGHPVVILRSLRLPGRILDPES